MQVEQFDRRLVGYEGTLPEMLALGAEKMQAGRGRFGFSGCIRRERAARCGTRSPRSHGGGIGSSGSSSRADGGRAVIVLLDTQTLAPNRPLSVLSSNHERVKMAILKRVYVGWALVGGTIGLVFGLVLMAGAMLYAIDQVGCMR